MRRRTMWVLVLAAGVGWLGGCAPGPVEIDPAKVPDAPGVEPKANEILYAAGEYLKQCTSFRVQAETAREEVLLGGLVVTSLGRTELACRRPGAFRVSHDGEAIHRRVYYDGKMLTICWPAKGFFAQAPIEGTTDHVLDETFRVLGFSMPMADLLYADLYPVLVDGVEFGRYVGPAVVDGRPCHHLAFHQAVVDWQVWIEDGPTPLIRRLAITYTAQVGAPTYTARLTQWDLNPGLGDDTFRFTPPADAEVIEFLAIEPPVPASAPADEPQTQEGK